MGKRGKRGKKWKGRRIKREEGSSDVDPDPEV